MEFRVLGSLEVVVGGRPVVLRSKRLRALLVVLLVSANRVVSFDELVEAVWGDEVPAHPRSAVQTCVTRLRNTVRDIEIQSRPDGYRIVVDESDVDLMRFEAGVGGNDAEVLRSALGLWRGEPFADVESDYLHRVVVPRLVERRLLALEWLFGLDIAAGRYDVAQLRALTEEYPLRERFWAQLLIALHRSGRQAEALRTYSEVRQRLVDELGVEPGAELRRAHQTVLAGADDTTGWQVHRQLPLDIAAFTGRDAELAHVVASLGGNSIVTISGLPGVGKSALAVRAAHRLAPNYPDGQWFVRLAGASARPRSATDLLSELLRTAGVAPATIPSKMDECAALLRSQLAGRKVLIVLDDARSVSQVAPLLPGRPGSAVIVTSRSALAGLSVLYGGNRVPLDPLAPDHAYQLLARLVGAQRCADDEGAATELADLCGRLPLALRIAAANLVGRPRLQISRYAEDLRTGDRVEMLTTSGESGVAVRAAFDTSYEALDEAERRAFRLLGLVPAGDIGAGAAAALFGSTLDEATTLLDRLAAANLIEYQNPDRFRFHDLIRDYAAIRAREHDDDREALGRWYEWYWRSTHSATSQSLAVLYISPLPAGSPGIVPETFDTDVACLDWLGNERANIIAAVEHAASQGLSQYTWLLTDAVRPYLHVLYYVSDLGRLVDCGLASAHDQADRRGEAVMLLVDGGLKAITGRFGQAVDVLAECRRLAHDLGEDGIESGAVIHQSGALLELGQPGRAVEVLNSILDLVDRLSASAPARRTSALLNLGEACLELGELDQALTVLTRALHYARDHASPIHEALAHMTLGHVLRETGDLDKSLAHLTAAYNNDVFRVTRNEEPLLGLAAVHRDAKRYDVAWEYVLSATDAAERARHRRYKADCLLMMASIQLCRDNVTEAFANFAAAAELATELQHIRAKVEALIGMALTGRPECIDEALALARKQGLRLLEGKALKALTRVQAG